jgi:ankyrin repeat protein
LNLANQRVLRQKGGVQVAVNTAGYSRYSIVWTCRSACLLILALAALTLGTASLSQASAPSPADTSLLKAAAAGDLALVKAAIAEGANVNCEGTNGLTPLLSALHGISAPAEANRRECVALLLQGGAKVDALDRNGQTALIYATRAGDLETVKVLVDAGAMIKRRDGFHKTAVLYAAECGRKEILIYLGQTLKVQQKQSAW